MKELSAHFLSFPVSRFQFDSHKLVSFLARCVSTRTFRRCVGLKYLVLSLVPAGGQGAVGGQWARGVCWFDVARSLGEGLGDGGGRVTGPAVKQL